MTTLAKSRLKKFLKSREEAREHFLSKIKALTPKEKQEILVQAGVLTKRGTFTAHYRKRTATRR